MDRSSAPQHFFSPLRDPPGHGLARRLLRLDSIDGTPFDRFCRFPVAFGGALLYTGFGFEGLKAG